MQPAFRFLLITSLQVAGVVVAFAFLMTLVFESGEWRKSDWVTDLLPLLAMILVINALVQIFRLRRRARGR
ncbi:hypothetical protein [Micromonospora halophytica]|uniref:Uncharacterized protein n=1 Tax=Micromonospora halophytica TaxID=47864 RepID=A0A1C5HNW2_9ACTN|nr:hypothetical protein [Micromonospora halophytica]SCG47613.1 hypothetical protein GA0070560_105139 [Micromonospora halophytica]